MTGWPNTPIEDIRGWLDLNGRVFAEFLRQASCHRAGEPIPMVMRPMRMRSHVTITCVALSLTACGTSNGSPAASDPTKDRLLAAADRAATANGGEAKHVEAVETTRGTAADLTGHSNQNQDEQVWVIQVSGGKYTCVYCHHPSGASPPGGRYITIVLRASDFESTDSGMGPSATDLSALGHVEVLRDHD